MSKSDPAAYFERMTADLPARYKKRLNTPSAYKVKVLPTVSRNSALHGRMNGKMDEIAAATFPKGHNKSANAPRSKVTGISAGGHIAGATWEDTRA